MKRIGYGRQEISEEDIAAVVAVLRSDWLTQGPAVEGFERAIAAYCGAPHATAVSSGTAALHLACRALELGPGDWLWTSANTFVASANCALYCGASVDFVDIDPRTASLSLDALADKLVAAERDGRLPKVVVPVHFAGLPCDLVRLRALADRYGFRIVEDATHALGARYRGEAIGSCRYSDMAVFSFHPVKPMTTGEGGMLMTRDAALDARLKRLRTHGITRDAAQMSRAPDGDWYYEQVELGYNYRITDLQCALGISQLERLDDFVARRAALADRYDEKLHGLPLEPLARSPDASSSWHLYVVRVGSAGGRTAQMYDALRAASVGVNVHYIPVHLQPYYQKLGFRRGDFPEAERYYREALTLPLFTTLGFETQDYVVDVLRRTVLRSAA